MGKDVLLGSFEEMVLLAVAQLGGRAYGMQVRREIERRTGRSAAIGAVYATLERMQEKGYLDSRTESATVGRRRRYFALQPAGAQVLRQARRLHEQMWKGVDVAAWEDKGGPQR